MLRTLLLSGGHALAPPACVFMGGCVGGGGGSAVSSGTARLRVRRRREGPEGLEDGTPSFLGIAAVPHGFQLLERLGGFPAIQAHAEAISR